MSPNEALEQLKNKVNINLDLELILKSFIEHYSTTDIDSCSKEEKEDMLLYQWGGPYSWDESFSINLTRQFSFYDDKGDYIGMKQLRMDCKFLPNEINIESGNFWFEEEKTEDFLSKILKSNSFNRAKNLKLQSVQFALNDI
jgi:hypothetical protein